MEQRSRPKVSPRRRGDSLHDVNEMQGPADFLEDLDDGEEVLALVFEVLDPLEKPFELLPLALSDRRGHARVRWLEMCQT